LLQVPLLWCSGSIALVFRFIASGSIAPAFRPEREKKNKKQQ
jgi:hypothetical protein